MYLLFHYLSLLINYQYSNALPASGSALTPFESTNELTKGTTNLDPRTIKQPYSDNNKHHQFIPANSEGLLRRRGWIEDIMDGDWESMSSSSSSSGAAASELEAAGISTEESALASTQFVALGESAQIEVPEAALAGTTYATTDGVLVGAGGVVMEEGAATVVGIEAGAEAVTAAAAGEVAVAEGLVVVEGGLLAMGPATLGLSVAVAVVMAAAAFAVVPLIHALEDHRQTKILKGFMFDIDGDKKPENITEFKSKLTPYNNFLYVKQGGMAEFFSHFHKREEYEFTERDDKYGDVHFKWKGSVWTGQTRVLGIVQDMTMTDTEKALAIFDVFEKPNTIHNEKRDHVWIDLDIDQDGNTEHMDIDYHGTGEGLDAMGGKLKIKGDIDGNNNRDKCEWEMGRLEHWCSESDSPSESDHND